MEQTPGLVQPWTMLLDPAAARSAIERISKLNLRRRVCRPLDRRGARAMNPELMQFDAAIDAEPSAADEDVGEITPETPPLTPSA